MDKCSLRGYTAMSFTPRVSQRKPLSCSECTRRKLRCSKTIPCTSCCDRGLEATCAREPVIVRKRHQRSYSNGASSSRRGSKAVSQSPDLSGSPITVESLCEVSSPDVSKSQHLSVTIPDDAPVTLENLALGRQRILNMRSPAASGVDGLVSPTWIPADADFVISLDQTRMLLRYHCRNLAWVHNVLHMPSFEEECEVAFQQRVFKCRAWIALFYAFLCVSIPLFAV
jgi:hypothetical protein